MRTIFGSEARELRLLSGDAWRSLFVSVRWSDRDPHVYRVAHLRARRGGKHAACVGTIHDRAQGRPVMQEPAAYVSLLESAIPWL